MNDGLIPKRYAKALYKLAVENGDSQEIYEQLKPLSRGLKGLDDLKRVLLNPHVKEEDKGRVMMQLVGAKPGSSLEKFLLLVIRNNRAEFLRKIALSYVNLYREEHDIAKVEIFSATELPEQQVEAIVDIIRRRMPGTTLEVQHIIDHELIGGFVVKVGDVLLDASVKNELNNLRLKLLS
jgi:F-type H+-transporting ATPase subunit delta